MRLEGSEKHSLPIRCFQGHLLAPCSLGFQTQFPFCAKAYTSDTLQHLQIASGEEILRKGAKLRLCIPYHKTFKVKFKHGFGTEIEGRFILLLQD